MLPESELGAGAAGAFDVGITGTEFVSSGNGLDEEPVAGFGAFAAGFGADGAACFSWDELGEESGV